MNNSLYIIIGLSFFVLSCAQPKPRKPVSQASGYDQSSSIAFNKKLYQGEADMIEKYMQNDSTNHYINSQHGFWYAYIDSIQNDEVTPIKGNTVTMQYDVFDFYGNEIYSSEEIGKVQYRVDQEDIIKGLQEGIKWMHKGEKVIFLLPSHKAYAYHGDENKIGPNTPIVVTLVLEDIQKNN